MRQYEIWWARLADSAGSRPVLLLSRDEAFRYLNAVLVVEITTSIRDIPQEVPLGPREGLPRSSVAQLDNIRRIGKWRLETRLGRLPAWRVREVKRALGNTLRWPELVNL